MEMTGKLLVWLVLEGIAGTKNLCYKHFDLFSDNMAAVSWTQKGAAKKSSASGSPLRVLYSQEPVTIVSPLVVAHVAGDPDVLGNIPYCSFGYSKNFHCTNDSEFLSLTNYQLALPHQCSWQGFRLSFALSTKMISKLAPTQTRKIKWCP